jgi:hypothetical protein
MQLSKIKVGKTVNYRGRVYEGRGKVVNIESLTNGTWVHVFDKERHNKGEFVKLRPAQILS